MFIFWGWLPTTFRFTRTNRMAVGAAQMSRIDRCGVFLKMAAQSFPKTTTDSSLKYCLNYWVCNPLLPALPTCWTMASTPSGNPYITMCDMFGTFKPIPRAVVATTTLQLPCPLRDDRTLFFLWGSVWLWNMPRFSIFFSGSLSTQESSPSSPNHSQSSWIVHLQLLHYPALDSRSADAVNASIGVPGIYRRTISKH